MNLLPAVRYRRFRVLSSSLLGLVLVCFAFSGSTEPRYKDGKDYRSLSTESQDSDGKVQVIEFFSYGCVHCYRFEPFLNKWLEQRQEDVEFRRIPVSFQSSWEPLARGFLISKEYDVFSKIHTPLFDAIHKYDQPYAQNDLAQFFSDQAGLEIEKFNAAYSSEATEKQLDDAKDLLRAWKIQVIPTMVVDNRFLVDTETASKRSRKFISIVDFLVDKVLEEQVSK